MDRSWMLNPKTIRVIKECMTLVKNEFDEKLALSNENFMQLLHEFVERSSSADLQEAYTRLLSMAGVGDVLKSLKPKNAMNFSETAAVKKAVGADLGNNVAPEPEPRLDTPRVKKPRGVYLGQPLHH